MDLRPSMIGVVNIKIRLTFLIVISFPAKNAILIIGINRVRISLVGPSMRAINFVNFFNGAFNFVIGHFLSRIVVHAILRLQQHYGLANFYVSGRLQQACLPTRMQHVTSKRIIMSIAKGE